MWKIQHFKTKSTYLKYYQTILMRVSFCNKLMHKEYQKAKKVINPAELKSLNSWLISNNLHRNLKVSREELTS